MAKSRMGWGRLLALGVMAGSMSTATAAPAAASDVDAGMLQELQTNLARSFALPEELPIDAPLRDEAERIAATHLARVKAQLPGWIQEERTAHAAAGGKPDGSGIFYAVWARLFNELALWQITPGDAAYERAILDTVISAPRICQVADAYRFSDYSSRIMRLQAMAPAMRQAALATERSLLERWGKPHTDIAPLPQPLPQELGMVALHRMQAGGAPPPVALPPALASAMLAARGEYAQQPWETKCRFQQWWLRVNLAQGMAPTAALTAFRYGTMLTADERMFDWFEPRDQPGKKAQVASGESPQYPALARRFQVTGVTTVTRTLDATGKVDVQLTARETTVNGIRGVRAVAFETVFDKLSRSHALQASTAPNQYKMVWNLNPYPDEPAKGAK